MASFPATIAQKKLQLYTADGRLIQTITLPLGSTQKSIDVQMLVKGKYYLKDIESEVLVTFVKQ